MFPNNPIFKNFVTRTNISSRYIITKQESCVFKKILFGLLVAGIWMSFCGQVFGRLICKCSCMKHLTLNTVRNAWYAVDAFEMGRAKRKHKFTF